MADELKDNEAFQKEMEARMFAEQEFGRSLTKLVNDTLQKVPFPSVIFQIDTVSFELKYKQQRMNEMTSQMMLQKAGRASGIVPAKTLPKEK